jgi:hypothetical protein
MLVFWKLNVHEFVLQAALGDVGAELPLDDFARVAFNRAAGDATRGDMEVVGDYFGLPRLGR